MLCGQNSDPVPHSIGKGLIVKPVLKKQSMSTEEFSRFRPVSNLKFISKAIEKVVAVQLIDHLDKNNLHEPFQSAYKKYYSVETALLRVQNDILKAIDSQRCVVLVLLDLSAAFDTVNHKILLERMFSKFGVTGMALKWFEPYLADRNFRVAVRGGVSSCRTVHCGVPHVQSWVPFCF